MSSPPCRVRVSYACLTRFANCLILRPTLYDRPHCLECLSSFCTCYGGFSVYRNGLSRPENPFMEMVCPALKIRLWKWLCRNIFHLWKRLYRDSTRLWEWQGVTKQIYGSSSGLGIGSGYTNILINL